MGLFSNPKCPHCGVILMSTNYSFPFPQWRCKNCKKKNSQLKKLENKIKELETKLNSNE